MSSFSKILPGLFSKFTKTMPLWALILIALIAVVIVYFVYKSNVEGFESGREIKLDYVDISGIDLQNGFYMYPKSGHILRNTGSQYLLYKRVAESNGNVLDSSLNITSDGGMDADALLTIPDSSLTDSYRSWQVNKADDTDNNSQLFLIPYGTNTYVHIIDLTENNHYTYYSVNGGNPIAELQNLSMNVEPAAESGSYNFTSTSRGPINYDNGALKLDRDTYQVAENVFFDQQNGDLYVKGLGEDGNQKIFVYTRDYKNTSSAKEVTSGNVSDVNTKSSIGDLGKSDFTNSFMVKDEQDNNLVLYLCAGSSIKTVIAVFHKNQDGQYDLVNVKRFNGDSVETTGSGSNSDSGEEGNENESEAEGQSNDDSSGNSNSESNGSNEQNKHKMKNPDNIDDYYKWYWYWNTADSLPVHFSEDYMLKTQMVPPVCPACPACPGTKEGGCCTNCGGNGGSGTKNEKGESVIKNDKKDEKGNPIGDAYGKTLDTGSDLLKSGGSGAVNLTRDVIGLGADGVKGAAGMAKDAVGGTVDIAKDAVGGTVDLAKNTVGGTVDLAKSTVGGTVDLAKNTVGGTVDLAKDAVGGTVGLAKDVIGGTADFVKGLGSGATQLNNDGRTGYYGAPTYNQAPIGQYGSQITGQVPKGPADPYTYNGKLQQKPPSNFLPVTADFSAFAK